LLSEGRSQASATIAQICSAVIRAGAPERGASLKRSEAGAEPSEPASQRARHWPTVLRQTPSRSAVSPTPKPSPAIKIKGIKPSRAAQAEKTEGLRVKISARMN
jgi:hypothetical protein